MNTSKTLITNFSQIKNLTKPESWLAAIAIVLATIHLTMIWRVGALSYGGLSFLFWCGVASLLWDKRETLNFRSGMFATLFAIALLIPTLIKSVFLMKMSSSSLYIFPVVAGFSLALLASGFRGLFQYRRELLIFFILGAIQPMINLLNNFDPSFLTAKFASMVLWYSGFDIVRQGTDILFAGSSNGVEVYPGCSGLDAMIHLLSLSLLFFLLFPSNLQTKILLPLSAIVIGFIVNGFRVSLLAVIVAYHEKKGFEYWHSGEGSLLFSMFAAGLLCTVAYLLVHSFIKSDKTLTQLTKGNIWP